jgi:hypothetical protein
MASSYVCFMRFICMFYLDIACVSSRCCICCNGIHYVASVYFKCFSCFKSMLQVFYLNVAYIAMAIDVCCKCMFQMFQLFETYVASVLSICCICCTGYTHMLQVYMFQLFSKVCYKCFIWILHMLQWQYTYIASVCLQMFYLFRTYVAANALCCKCCMTMCGKWAQTEVVSLGAAVHTCVSEVKRAQRPPHACAVACVLLQQVGQTDRRGSSRARRQQ